jgi:HEXXH motif-containing protein
MDVLPSALLSLPEAGDHTFDSIRAKVERIAVKQLLTLASSGLGPSITRALPPLQWALTRDLKRSPERVVAAVSSPDVLAPILALASGAHPADDCVARAVPSVLAELGTLPEEVAWELPIAMLVDTRRQRVLHFSPPASGLRIGPGGVLIRVGDETHHLDADDAAMSAIPNTRIERPFTALHPELPTLRLATIDTNPLAMLEAHPEKLGNAIDLGGREVAAWVQALRDALELVKVALPTWWHELPRALDRLVPVEWHAERHFSTSYREAPLVAYLTMHPDPLTLAEAIVHETQHGKLNLLSWLDPVLDNAYTEWTSSPVRPDLRPVMGVLLAVHAFVPVAALHHGLQAADHAVSRTAQFALRRDAVLAGNARGLAILREKAKPTASGARLLHDLEGLHASLMRAGWAKTAQAAIDIFPG